MFWEILTQPTTASLLLRGNVYNSVGNLWLDDFVVEEIPRVQPAGSGGENRWVIDQVMDKDGPEVYRNLSRAVDSLFG